MSEEFTFKVQQVDTKNSNLYIVYYPKNELLSKRNVNLYTPPSLLVKGNEENLKDHIISASPQELWENEKYVLERKEDDLNDVVSSFEGTEVNYEDIDRASNKPVEDINSNQEIDL